MALIKPAQGITDIKGRLAGNIYKRDASGLHMTATRRHIRSNATEEQRLQRNWYAGKKHEEKGGTPPEESYEEPDEKTTATIYSLEAIWAHRTPTLFAPQINDFETAGFWPDQIQTWVNNNWIPGYGEWGLSKNLMFLMTLKWFYVLQYIRGFGAAVAFAGAKVNMLNWIAASAAAVAVPVLTLWGGLVIFTFYLSVLDWFEGQSGHVSFNKGRVLIKLKSGLCWGGIDSRPSKEMYDFRLCSPTDFGGYTWWRNPDTPKYMLNFLYLRGLWTTTLKAFIGWHIYEWQTIRMRHRGRAYVVAPAKYRMNVSESQIEYWGHPVGWENEDPLLCVYPNALEAHFQYPGHPADPL